MPPKPAPSTLQFERYADWLRGVLPASWGVPHHIQAACEHIDALIVGEIDRLAIRMPPRHGKTENLTVRLPVRWFQQWPEANVLLTGYNERFARRLGRKTRNAARGAVAIAQDSTAVDEWHTTAGGVLMTRGVGSPPTGTGFDLIIIDDPTKSREDAESELKREAAWDWYSDDIYTRLEPGGRIMMVMTPWHEDGIDARAIASEPGKWTVLSLPAIAEPDDPLGRAVGDALWRERYDAESLARIESVMDPRSWRSLYQMDPRPREGAFFHPDRIREVFEPPAPIVRQCRAWDLAATEDAGDYTVGVLGCRDADGGFGVLDVQRGRWDSHARDRRMLEVAEKDGRGVVIHLPQDPGQAGKDQAQRLIRMLAGYIVRSEPVSGAKEVRASGYASQVNAGNTWMLSASWNRSYREELRGFMPGCLYDDQVDAGSDAFTELLTLRKARIS